MKIGELDFYAMVRLYQWSKETFKEYPVSYEDSEGDSDIVIGRVWGGERGGQYVIYLWLEDPRIHIDEKNLREGNFIIPQNPFFRITVNGRGDNCHTSFNVPQGCLDDPKFIQILNGILGSVFSSHLESGSKEYDRAYEEWFNSMVEASGIAAYEIKEG